MVRRIVEIDPKKCNGCGLCASACHEGAIGMVDGKATLLKDDYCDGLGDCLPACPTGAISFVEREAAAYDEAAVQVHMAARKAKQVLEANAAANASARSEAKPATPAFGGCPGSMSRFLKRPDTATSHASSAATSTSASSQETTGMETSSMETEGDGIIDGLMNDVEKGANDVKDGVDDITGESNTVNESGTNNTTEAR